MTLVLGPGTSKKASFAEKLGGGLGVAAEIVGKRHELAQAEKENQALSRMTGKDFTDIGNPNLKKEALGELLRGNIAREKGEAGKVEDEKTYGVIEGIAGKKVADLWKAATLGGRTKIMGGIIESAQRGMSFGEMFGAEGEKLRPNEEVIGEEIVTPNMGEEAPKKVSSKPMDYDKGLTPRERASRQEGRYAKNLPLFTESQKKLKSQELQKEELGILEELSPQITFMERFNMNPMTGELIFPGLASPEAQRFVKTINDFTVSAKDSYGSRVTNFDLNQFLKRLPTLANSQEGRRAIIDQMKIITDINMAYENSLHNVFDEHGGIRNLDYDRAQSIADSRAKPQVDALKARFKTISHEAEKDVKRSVDEFKKITPKGHVAVQKADGRMGYIPQDKLKEFLDTKAGTAL